MEKAVEIVNLWFTGSITGRTLWNNDSQTMIDNIFPPVILSPKNQCKMQW